MRLPLPLALVLLQGLAHAEKTEVRASRQLKKKQAVATLKTLY
jgi:hypothetical protein